MYGYVYVWSLVVVIFSVNLFCDRSSLAKYLNNYINFAFKYSFFKLHRLSAIVS